MAAKKRQNKITEYRKMLLAWRKPGSSPMPATSSAFPATRAKSILRDIEIIKSELPVDILEFFFLTPLPGSEDHKVLWSKGVWMDPDMNKYDLEHVVAGHPKMSGRNGRISIAKPGAPITRPTTSRRSYAAVLPSAWASLACSQNCSSTRRLFRSRTCIRYSAAHFA